MKETVLNALLQLFAIIANVSEDGVSFKARSIVKAFLRHHLKTNLINNYLVVFDRYLEMHHPHLFGGGVSATSQTLSDADKLMRISEEINRSLLQREKFIVFLRLVEFINEDDVMTERELAFIKAVADTFNISRPEHDNTKAFVLNDCDEIEKDRILIIDSKPRPFIRGIRHIQEKELEGRIAILHHTSTDTFVFRYLGNMNLFLNGHHIIPEKFELLEHGSRITGARINPIYYSDISRKFHHQEEASKICFVAKDIEYTFKNSNKGIKRFSFSKESGNLIGIMGGSGAGKSTLLNILSGKIRPQNGTITINGFDIHREQSEIEGIIGFVPQDDLLMEDLTVFQNLYLNAKLCLSNCSQTELLKRINQILVDLDLDDTRHLKVGNPLKKFISGGQRKRLNIALELIRQPAVLFVDEPTSGLSSMGSEKVMLLLKEQALKGRLVIVNIHQPYSDIYKLFDQFMILDQEGYIIYKGNPIDAITYFKSLSNYVNAEVGQCVSCGNVMPEEILKMVEAKEIDEYGRVTKERKMAPEDWYDIYRHNIEAKQVVEPVKAALPEIEFRIPGRLRQFSIFSTRMILSRMANRQYMLLTFLEAPLLALIIGYFTRYASDTSASISYVLRENVNLFAYMFIAVIIPIFIGLTLSADEIMSDRKILEREAFLRLSRLSYLHSKILILFAISAIQTLTFALVGNSILGIRGMLFSYWAVMFTVACLGNMIGLNLSSGLNSMATANLIIPFFVVLQMFFSGVVIQFDKLNGFRKNPEFVPLIGELMTSRWAYEALAVHQFKANRFTREFFELERTWNNAVYEIDRIDYLEPIIRDLLRPATSGANEVARENTFTLARNELATMTASGIVSSFGPVDDLFPGRFNEEALTTISDSLRKMRNYYLALKIAAGRQIDEKSAELIDRWGGKEAYVKMENAYTNKRLEDWVATKEELFMEWKGRLVRKFTLVYMEPLSRTGRAHFFASSKKLGNLSVDTFWFNLVIIWLSTLFYYIILVYDVPRKLADWNEARKLRQM